MTVNWLLQNDHTAWTVQWSNTNGISHNVIVTAWNRVLLEKLTGSILIKKFPPFYGTRNFSTPFTTAYNLSLFWAISIQSITPSPTSWWFILILSTNLCLRLPNGAFPSVSPQTAYIRLSSPPYAQHAAILSFFSDCYNSNSSTLPHIIRCQYHCTQHSSSLSQSVAHCTDVTVYNTIQHCTQHSSSLSQSVAHCTDVTVYSCIQHCTQHNSSLSQPVAHCTDATVDEKTNRKPQSAIPVLSSSSVMFQRSSMSVM